MSRKAHHRARDKVYLQKRRELAAHYIEPTIRTPVADPGIAVRATPIDAVVYQLASIKENARSFLTGDGDDGVWAADIRACDAAVDILTALRDEGVHDAEAVRDLLYDYRLANRQLRTMMKERKCHEKH